MLLRFVILKMNKPVFHKVFNNPCGFHADRCIYWESQQFLILIGSYISAKQVISEKKASQYHKKYIKKISALVLPDTVFQPRKLIIVGDMFHSKAKQGNRAYLKNGEAIFHDEYRIGKRQSRYFAG